MFIEPGEKRQIIGVTPQKGHCRVGVGVVKGNDCPEVIAALKDFVGLFLNGTGNAGASGKR